MEYHFFIGERVRFLDQKGEGTIKSIKQNNVVVEDESGFEWSFAKNKIVKIHTENPNPQPPTQGQKGYKQVDLQQGVFIFIPEAEEPNRNKKNQIVNNTSYNLMLALYSAGKENYKKIWYGVAKANKVSECFEVENTNDLKKISLHLMVVSDTISSDPELISKSIKLSEEVLLGDENPVYNFYSSIPGYFKELVSESSINETFLKKNLDANSFQTLDKNNPSNKNTLVKKEELIIDLHIEELLENSEKLSPLEKLDFQIKHFENYLSAAFEQGYKRLIVIHGVGKGVLKDSIKERLKDYSFVSHRDADYLRFGYGATEVILR